MSDIDIEISIPTLPNSFGSYTEGSYCLCLSLKMRYLQLLVLKKLYYVVLLLAKGQTELVNQVTEDNC